MCAWLCRQVQSYYYTGKDWRGGGGDNAGFGIISLSSATQCAIASYNVMQIQAPRPLQLVTALGEQLPIVEHIRAPIKVGELELMHDFVVVDSLVAPVILKVDFLQGNG